MKQSFSDVVGNKTLCARLLSDLTEGRISHAYIIEGPAGTGKHTLALRIAAALACERAADTNVPLPCHTCPSCKKILSGNSVDVIYVNRGDKATLGVDPIRALRGDVYIAPNDTSVKVYIIEDAHLMTQQAQNAFLLTLEEPPAYVLFLLLCESATALLETVRSRAPTLRTEPIPPEEIGAYLLRVSPEAAQLERNSPEEFSELLVAADGSIGRALELLDPKARKPILTQRELAKEFVRLATARRDGVATMRLIASLGQKRDELSDQLSAVLLCLRDLLLIKQTESAPLCFFADREEASNLAYQFTTPSILRLYDVVSDAIDQLRKNRNVRLTLTSLAVGAGLL